MKMTEGSRQEGSSSPDIGFGRAGQRVAVKLEAFNFTD
jgi:phosphoglycerate dehydrogenase-like enzyme